MLRSLLRLAPFVLVFAGLAACESDGPEGIPSGPVESADALADAVEARFDASIAGLDAFRAFGAGVSIYYVAGPDSLAPFGLVRDPESGPPSDPIAANIFGYFPPNGRIVAQGLRGATFAGTAERGGVQTYVAETTDPASVGLGADSTARDHLVRVYVDAETFEVRELYHRFMLDTLAQPLAQRIVYEDWREVAGEDGATARFPFTVRRFQEGLLQVVSDDERMIVGGQLGMQEQGAQRLPAGPKRDSALAAIARRKRVYEDGVAEDVLVLSRIEVNPVIADSLMRPRNPFPFLDRERGGVRDENLMEGAPIE